MKTQPGQPESLAIVIVDSGMGGLSICAEIASGLSEKRSFRQVDLTYFNAWPEQNRGYNALPGMAERIRVFNSALLAIERLAPDIILIACNTLSILYPQTPFAAAARVPVVGIIDFGVEMAYEQLQHYPESQAIILGTLTTIETRTHAIALINKGIDPERIIGQPCDQLATKIESGPESAVVSQMIDRFIREAAGKVRPQATPVFAVFGCTHYGYSRGLFETSLKRHIGNHTRIINPNTAMSHHLLDRYRPGVVAETGVQVRVVSRIIWRDEMVNAISASLLAVSPPTAEALRNYQPDPNLFAV
ncbi:MAG: aspartate/glutamate racemase family protein [bacterium]